MTKRSVNGVLEDFTEEEEAALVKHKAEFASKAPALLCERTRRDAYPSVVAQLDLLYHDMVADKGDKTGEWFKAILAVKNANPKGGA
jgi:hypothetical protein